MNCYTSDTHAFHLNILKYSNRPFKSLEDMHKDFADNVNSVAGKKDIVVHCGDFALGPKHNKKIQLKNAIAFREMINCPNVALTFGNHDYLYENDKFKKLFFKTGDALRIYDPDLKTDIIASHYAMVVWNASHYGRISIYGHSHSTLEPWMDYFMPGHRSMDVGVDNAIKILGKYIPFTSYDLHKIMADRKGFSPDRHGERIK